MIVTHKQDHCWLNLWDLLMARILIHQEEEKLISYSVVKKQLLIFNSVGGTWMWSIAHFITNNLNYFIPLNNLSIFCYRPALELSPSFKAGCLSIFFESQTCPAARMSEEGGSWRISQAWCAQEDRSMLSLSLFLTKERGNDGGVLTCSSQNNPQCLKLPFWSSATLLCAAAHSSQHPRICVRLETPGSTNEDTRCISFVSSQSVLGREERAEFSSRYHPRTWLHSPNIIYTHGFLPSAISENVSKATKIGNTDGKFMFWEAVLWIAEDEENSTNKNP